nr:hypothetical protein [Angustibacter aerolatus]
MSEGPGGWASPSGGDGWGSPAGEPAPGPQPVPAQPAPLGAPPGYGPPPVAWGAAGSAPAWGGGPTWTAPSGPDAGWRPPPKPGVVPLRPLNLGEPDRRLGADHAAEPPRAVRPVGRGHGRGVPALDGAAGARAAAAGRGPAG